MSVLCFTVPDFVCWTVFFIVYLFILLTVCVCLILCFCLSLCLCLSCYGCISSLFHFLVLMRFDTNAKECLPLGLLAASPDSVPASFCRHEIAQRRSTPTQKPFCCSSCLYFHPAESKCFGKAWKIGDANWKKDLENRDCRWVEPLSWRIELIGGLR